MSQITEHYVGLHAEFIEAAAKYESAGYETSIHRNASIEEGHIRLGRHDCLAFIRWPYEPYRECMILAPGDGVDEEPCSVMKALFTRAWLGLPQDATRVIVDTAAKHHQSSGKQALHWAHQDYQFWSWLIWFDWIWGVVERKRTEPIPPAAGMDLRPFSYSAKLISRWGLDGSVCTMRAADDDSPLSKNGAYWPGALNKVLRRAGVEVQVSNSGVKGVTSRAVIGRQRRSSAEVDSLLSSVLTKHHVYTGSGIERFEAMAYAQICEESKLSPSTVGSALKRAFPTMIGTAYQKYEEACRLRRPLVEYLAKSNGDILPVKREFEFREEDGHGASGQRRHGSLPSSDE